MKKLFVDQSNLSNSDEDNDDRNSTNSDKHPMVLYQIGDIVCGHVGKYPWWPCMISAPPNNENINDSSKLSKYFVRYFGRSNEVSWLGLSGIININTRQLLHAELILRYKKIELGSYRDELNKAWEEVEEALTMTVEERLTKFVIDYAVIEAKINKNKKKRSRPKSVVRKVEVQPIVKTKKKDIEKKSIKYAFTELDMPFNSLPSHHKCCRYCLISNKYTVKCTCGNSFHTDCSEELKSHLTVDLVDGGKCVECCVDYRLCAACSRVVRHEEEQAVHCSEASCGRIYHRTCLETGSLAEMARRTLFDKVICPRHLCHRCELIDENPKFKCSKLIHCIMCAATYHTGDWCVPIASVQLSKTQIICPRHLPGYGTMPSYVPPFIGRITSDIQSTIYGDSLVPTNEIVQLTLPKDTGKPFNVNWCFSCTKDGNLICCESCPATFHMDCANLQTIPDRYYCASCTNGKYHNYGEIVWIKCGAYRWWPGQIMHLENVPTNILNKVHSQCQFVVQFFGSHEYFWIDRGRVFTFEADDKHNLKGKSKNNFEKYFSWGLEEAEIGFKERELAWASASCDGVQKSRAYRHIKINKPCGLVKKSKDLIISIYPTCDCSLSKAGNNCHIKSDCINVQLKYECHQSFCDMKDKCQNQNFVQRNYPKQEVFCSAKCGWGLKTLEKIEKHQFVNEYVGEIIDNKEAERRREWAKENNITDFYFMELDKSRLIDARGYSNLSRFMNHSCNPNLFAEKWIVIDDQRIGLFALRDIEAGEELTFNYNLYSKSSTLLPCLCGSVNCSGFLGEQPKKLITKSKSLTSIKKSIKKKPKHRLLKVKKLDLDAAESISKGSMSNSISTVSLSTIKSVDKQCFRCSEYCNEITDRTCCLDFCTKIYHNSCLDLPPSYDSQLWACPWHFCDTCGRFASHSCELCTVSFCNVHFSTDNFQKMFSPHDGICVNHDDD